MKRLLLPLITALVLPAQAGVDPEVREACLKAVDFEGCVRAYTYPKANIEKQKLDFLGKPVIPGWKRYEQRSENSIFYFNHLNTTKVKARSQFGRYISFDYIQRWYQEPIAGTSGRTRTIGSAMTNCYGGSSSMNCTTLPAPTINIPGRDPVPGGVRQKKVRVVIDCLDEKYKQFGASESKKWFKLSKKYMTEEVARRYCNEISSLKPSDFIKWEEGNPTAKDNLAIEVLSTRADDQFIGIGVWIWEDADRNRPIILEVLNGTPAFKGGLKDQDLIMTIDGNSTRRMSIEEATQLIRGRAGTTVIIEVERNGSLLKIPITREKFKV